MSRRIYILIFLLLYVVGCSRSHVSEKESYSKEPDAKDPQEEVSFDEKRYIDPQEWIYEKYDWLNISDLKAIEISTPTESLLITDQEILQRFLNEIDVHYVTSNIGSPILPEIGSYIYALKSEESTVKIEVLGAIFRSVDDPDVYFYGANDLSVLGKAFVSSNELLLDLPLLYKLWDSAIVKINNQFIVMSSGRIQSLVSTIEEANPMEKVDVNKEPVVELTFYRYGEIFVMLVFNDIVQIQVNNENFFFQIPNIGEEILNIINAG